MTSVSDRAVPTTMEGQPDRGVLADPHASSAASAFRDALASAQARGSAGRRDQARHPDEQLRHAAGGMHGGVASVLPASQHSAAQGAERSADQQSGRRAEGTAAPAASDRRRAALHGDADDVSAGEPAPGSAPSHGAGHLEAPPQQSAHNARAGGEGDAPPDLSSRGVTVQLTDESVPVTSLDVNLLPDGAVDLVINLPTQALSKASGQLDRLRRRLESRGVSVAGLQLDDSEPQGGLGGSSR